MEFEQTMVSISHSIGRFGIANGRDKHEDSWYQNSKCVLARYRMQVQD